MALHQRNLATKLPAADSENALVHHVGKQVSKPLVSRRPALGEVGNKLHAQSKIGIVKEIGNVQIKEDVKQMKKPIAVSKKQTIATASNEDVAKKKVEKPPPAKTGKVTVQRQESTLIKNIIQTANSQKISVSEVAAYSTRQLMHVLDEDAKDKDDPFLVSEYVQDIFQHLFSLELQYPIRANFLVNHRSTGRMRAILINWMVEVHLNFRFMLETLHMSVAIVDRYLQANTGTGRQTLQLVGTSALLVAAKYEEMYIPDLSDFVYICDDTFTRTQILSMEKDILKKLSFNLGRPLSLHFLRRFNKVANALPEHHALAKYILELALIYADVCYIRPSLQAAAACCLSISIWDELKDTDQIWTKKMEHYSLYKHKQIRPVMVEFAKILSKADSCDHKAIPKKYASSKLFKVSTSYKLKGTLVEQLAQEVQDNKNNK